MRLARLLRPSARRRCWPALCTAAVVLATPSAGAAFAPGSTTLISAAPGGAAFPEPGVSAAVADQGSVSDDGRFVVFSASGAGLAPDAPAQAAYLKDLVTGTVTLVSRRPGLAGAPIYATALALSDDATQVAFLTAEALSPDDTNTTEDVYVRTLATGQTALATTNAAGSAIGGLEPGEAALAGGGRYLAFATPENAAPGDGNGISDVYVKDLQLGGVTLASQQPSTGTAITGFAPSISDDGTRVAFISLGAGGGYDTNGLPDAYVIDRMTSTLLLGSRQNGAGGGASPTGQTTEAVLSGDGGTVAFVSTGADYSDGGNARAVHRHILGTTVTQLASRADGPSGVAADLANDQISINDGGNVIAFRSAAGNLDAVSEPSGTVKAFVRRSVAGETERVSVRDDGTPFTGVRDLVIAGNGQHVALQRGGDDPGAVGAAADLDPRTEQVVLRDLTQPTRRTLSVSRPAGDASQVQPLRRVVGRPDLSANGRYVAFAADAPGYLPAGATTRIGIYRRDLVTGAIAFASLAPDGSVLAGNAASSPSISDDGSRIAFAIGTTGIGGTSTSSFGSVYVRDLSAGTTVVVDSAPNDTTSFGTSGTPVISGDGRRVAFRTRARLISKDGLSTESIYLRELATLETTLVSKSPSSQDSDTRAPRSPAINADGSRVAFVSDWNGYGDGAPGGQDDVHVALVATGQVLLASSSSAGTAATGASYGPQLDATGTHVAFTTDAKLAPGDADTADDAVVKDLASGSVEALGVISGQAKATDDSTLIDLSPDGRRALVLSRAALDPSAPTTTDNLFLRDRDAGTTALVSRQDGPAGAPLDDDVDQASLDASGSCAAFLTDSGALTSPLGYGRAYLRAVRGECPVPAPPAGGGAGSTTSGGTGATSALRITGLALAPKRPRSGRAFTVRFTLSSAARVQARIERVLPGRLRKGRCTTAARAPRGKRCDRFKVAGTIAAKDLAAGAGELRSSGRFARKRLPAGRYRITLTATPRTGAAATATTTFTVLKATR